MTHESRKEEINSNFQIFFELSDTYKYIFIKTRNTTQCQKTQLPQKPLSLLSSTSTNNRDHSLKRHSSRNETPESSSLKNFISPRIPFYKRNTVAGISDSSRNLKQMMFVQGFQLAMQSQHGVWTRRTWGCPCGERGKRGRDESSFIERRTIVISMFLDTCSP